MGVRWRFIWFCTLFKSRSTSSRRILNGQILMNFFIFPLGFSGSAVQRFYASMSSYLIIPLLAYCLRYSAFSHVTKASFEPLPYPFVIGKWGLSN